MIIYYIKSFRDFLLTIREFYFIYNWITFLQYFLRFYRYAVLPSILSFGYTVSVINLQYDFYMGIFYRSRIAKQIYEKRC